MSINKHIVLSPKQMQELGKTFSKTSKKGDIFLLSGDLGAGKTLFSKGFIKGLCKGIKTVQSPTFSILNTYKSDNGIEIFHYDLYRIEKEQELEELAIQEAFSEGITLIEWPEKLGRYNPVKHKEIKINIIDSKTREVIIKDEP